MPPVGLARVRQGRPVVVGIGVDVVDVARLARALSRTPRLADRLFTDAERRRSDGAPRSPEGLAARFAAKEAVAKALGAPGGLGWTEAEVVVDGRGRPSLRVHGAVARAAEQAGVRRWHVSLSHDAGVAVAQVVAEG